MNLRERLTSTPQFRELRADELDCLAAAMELIEAEDGHVLIKEGARGDGCFFIVDGNVRISHDRDGKTVRIQDLDPGELFGLVALLDDKSRSATCTAVGPTTVAWLPSAAFTMLHEGNATLVLHFQKLVVRQLAHDARELNAALVRAMVAKEQGESPKGGSLSGELHLNADD
jgi:CRP/FNR family cyclic AMP-dependent transcriptional regulator